MFTMFRIGDVTVQKPYYTGETFGLRNNADVRVNFHTGCIVCIG